MDDQHESLAASAGGDLKGAPGRNAVSRANHVHDSLWSAIKRGEFALGERVREKDVAKGLGVSRTPVREALYRLRERGILELTPGGLVVANLSRPQILELYEMREVLEGSAARFAASHASPSELETLRRIASAFEAAGEEPARLARINDEFHNAIYEAAHNRYLIRTLGELHDSLALLPGTTFSVAGRRQASVDEHRRLLEAIESHRPDEAELLARSHTHAAMEARLQMMFSDF